MPRPRAVRRFGARLRRRAGALLVDGFFQGVSRASRLLPRARAELDKLDLTSDVPYLDSGDRAHLLDIYRTKEPADAPRPVVLYVHGGGFRILSKDTHWLMALVFARAGYLVFNVSYRLAPKHPFPAAVQDACAAYEWVVENAARYGGDVSRLVLAGESAGGNLVTSLALAASYRRPEPWARRVFDTEVMPRAVVPACGMLQVTDAERFARTDNRVTAFLNDRILEVSRAYLRGVDLEDERALDLADPLVTLERGDAPERPLPPFFVPCGADDPILDDSRRLEAALQKLGVACEARYYEGGHHAFHAFVNFENARQCWRDKLDFLDRHVSSPPERAAARVSAP